MLSAYVTRKVGPMNVGKKTRNHALERCLRLIQESSGDVKTMAERLGVDARTIFRDLHSLKAAGWNIEITGGRRAATFRSLRKKGAA
jgi:predicted DNA-binding transcriptional regulator YafY